MNLPYPGQKNNDETSTVNRINLMDKDIRLIKDAIEELSDRTGTVVGLLYKEINKLKIIVTVLQVTVVFETVYLLVKFF